MKKLLLLGFGALLTLTAHAQLNVLSNFDSFNPTFYGFSGSWSADTAASGPDTFAIDDFGAGTPKNDGSFTTWLGAPQDFAAYSLVVVDGAVRPGNATASFAFFMEDADGNGGLATFATANFGSGQSYTSLAGLYSMVDAHHIVSWGFTTENQAGDAPFAFTFDKLALATTAPIPEPATSAVFTGCLAGIGFLVRRRRTA